MTEHTPASEHIRYQVAVESISAHLFSVQLDIEKPVLQGQKLSMPAWIPGSYMIRDFAKNVVTFQAFSHSGKPLSYKKIDKQTWQIEPHTGPIRVQYQVYAFDLSVRSAYLCDDYAFFNGTSVFLRVDKQEQMPCQVQLFHPAFDCADTWKVATTLPQVATSQQHHFGDYVAASYAELIEHPVLYADYDLVSWHLDGIKFDLVLAGGHQADLKRMRDDLQRLCQFHLDMFGAPHPINHYQFITLLTHGGFGGLEHLSSTALMFARDDLPKASDRHHMPDGYRTFLSLCSHELFHTWHVKRIQPQVLQGHDLSQEAYTEQLWIFEGFTSYYDDLSLARTGVIEPQSYLELLGQQLTRLQRNLGRTRQTVTESSYDAWTRFYQQDASAVNNIVSYYNKGAIIALCLDLKIRALSDNHLSLDNVMRLLWELHGKTGLGTDKYVIQQLLDQRLNVDVDEFLHHALYTTEELPVAELLADVGVEMRLRPRESLADKGGKPAKTVTAHWLGANVKALSTGAKITQVVEKSPACIAGLQVGDQLLAIDGWQVSADNLQRLLDNCHPGTNVALHCLRDHKMKTLQLPVMPAPSDTVYLEIKDQDKALVWLTGSAAALDKSEG